MTSPAMTPEELRQAAERTLRRIKHDWSKYKGEDSAAGAIYDSQQLAIAYLTRRQPMTGSIQTVDDLRFVADMMRVESEKWLAEEDDGTDPDMVKHHRCQLQIAEFFLHNYGVEPPRMPAGQPPPRTVEVHTRPECTWNYCPNAGGCPEKCEHPAQ